METITCSATVWVWNGESVWHFITIPSEYYPLLRSIGMSGGRGFGSVRVQATIGKTTWSTSVFPDAKTKTFLLPLKKSVRTIEQLQADSNVRVTLKVKE
jgi:hypothetical protein